jgi:hypothetical protein
MQRTTAAGGALCTALLSLPLSIAHATPPANDDCATATPFNGLWISDEVNSAQASIQPCEASCGDGSVEGHSVWYRVEVPTDGFLELSVITTYPIRVSMFDGCAIPSQFGCIQPDCLASSNAGIGWLGVAWIEWENVPVSGGSTYLIKVSSTDQYAGDVLIDACVHPYLPHDNPTHAKVITGIEYTDTLDIIGAHTDDCEMSEWLGCFDSWVSDTVWYRYTAPVSGVVSLHTFGSDINTSLAAYDTIPFEDAGGWCHEAQALSCTNLPGENGTLLALPMNEGETRWFRVDANWEGALSPQLGIPYNLFFSFGFVPTAAPANDLCSTAIQILTTSYHPQPLPVAGAAASTNEPSETCESLNAGVNDTVYYRFTAPAAGTVSINTFGSDYDTVLSAFDGCGIMTLNGFVQPTLLACNNDAGGLLGSVSTISGLEMAEGDSIIIKVAANGPFGDGGVLDFNLDFTAGVPCVADLDHDGSVTAADLSIMLGAWGSNGPADLNGSGAVESADLALLLGAWGSCG